MEPLPAALPEHLARPASHPRDAGAKDGVTWVQTHLSHVFLTRDRVYKLRKAVALGFVDFSTRAERNADCLREVRLNRRLAPDVYLGVAAAEPTEDGFRVGPVVEAIDPEEAGLEHVVVMRRLPEGCDALSMLAGGALRPAHVDAVALRLAGFHDAHGLGVPSPYSPEAWQAAVERPVRENLELLEPLAGRLVPRATWRRVRDRARAFHESHRADFEARRLAGRAVDGHGDVHLQHVWFEPGRPEPLLVDCIEFRDDLRRIDAAADAAFLAMDLLYRGRSRLATRFLRVYASERDDFELFRVVDYFVSYRAAVRAKVAALAAGDVAIGAEQRRAAAGSARRHLSLSARALAPAPPGALALVAGIVGTGKSSAAAELADAAGGAVVASDRVRKHRAGLVPTDRSGAERGLYAPEAVDAVYAALLERAAPVVDSGRLAVLDATYALSRHREAALAWAEARGVRAVLVETRCEPATARARLARRAARGGDPSDAGVALYDWSAARFEPVRPAAGVPHHVARTDARGWRAALRRFARELAAPRAARPDHPNAEEPTPCRTDPSGTSCAATS